MGVELPTAWLHTGTISQHCAQFAHCYTAACVLPAGLATAELLGHWLVHISAVLLSFAIERISCCHQAYYPIRSNDEILERLCNSHQSTHHPSSLYFLVQKKKMTQQFSVLPTTPPHPPKKSKHCKLIIPESSSEPRFCTEEKDVIVFFFFPLSFVSKAPLRGLRSIDSYLI